MSCRNCGQRDDRLASLGKTKVIETPKAKPISAKENFRPVFIRIPNGSYINLTFASSIFIGDNNAIHAHVFAMPIQLTNPFSSREAAEKALVDLMQPETN